MTDHHSDKHLPHSGAPMGDHHPHARPKGHERQIDRDISLRGIGMTIFGLFLGTVIAMIAMWWMFEALFAAGLASDPEPPPLIEARRGVEPPGPRLQASPERDMEQWRAHQNALRTSYAWRDRDAGIARIPVGRAMELLAEEGLDSGMAAMAVSPAGDAAGATGTLGTTDTTGTAANQETAAGDSAVGGEVATGAARAGSGLDEPASADDAGGAS